METKEPWQTQFIILAYILTVKISIKDIIEAVTVVEYELYIAKSISVSNVLCLKNVL